MKKKIYYLLALFVSFLALSLNADSLYLKTNLSLAHIGDYIVTAQSKNYSVLHIVAKTSSTVTIEEITVPISKAPPKPYQWKQWVQQGAPNNCYWILYTLDLSTGHIIQSYSVPQQRIFESAEQDRFLATLLNLRFEPIPLTKRRRVGSGRVDAKGLWQPKMIFEGNVVDGISFGAYKAIWPKDNSELSGKTVEIYLPEQLDGYPSYFPYWLQVSNIIGRASLRIIDSGKGMISPVQARA